jgi:hypothetical protein
MATFLLRFAIDLREYRFPPFLRHNGPLFHRWLPDGERDAIVLDIPKSKAQLKLWFERRGFVEDGQIKYENKRREIEPDIMVKQGALDGGPLMGVLSGYVLSQEELAALQNEKRGDPVYEALGKKVINLICPDVSRFIHIIRRHYGQYWVRELHKWDSRNHSLGMYCSVTLDSEWSLDDGNTWHPFIPNNPVGYIHTLMRPMKRFTEYIGKEDWQRLAGYWRQGYSPSPSANILLRARELLDQGNLRHAFIEGASAFEVALYEFMRGRLRGRKILQDSLSNFYQLSLASQLTSIAVTLGLDVEDIENATKAIEIRNDIVHENYNPPSSSKDKLQALMHVTARLIPGPDIRFPTMNPGNRIRPVKDWESLA